MPTTSPAVEGAEAPPSSSSASWRRRRRRTRGRSSEWPEVCGFSIVGQGPSYVISVERDSLAHRAGLCPGDQLIDVDGHSVAEMSADAIVALARHHTAPGPWGPSSGAASSGAAFSSSSVLPPTLGVVSRVQFLELAADRRWGYGMRLKGIKPTVVETVYPSGPAYKAGVRPGDLVLEIEGHRIRKLELAESILREKFGTVTLAMIAIGNGPRNSRDHAFPRADLARSRASRVRKARDLFAKMNVVLGNDFEKKMALVGLLKQYAEKRNIETFSSAISILLDDSRHSALVREIRSFIPLKHRSQFDALLNSKLSPGVFREDQRRQWYNDLSEPRVFTIQRVDGSFGFVLRGHGPVCVESVLTGGPADRAGLRPGDAITKLNGIDVRKCSHEYLVKLLQDSGEAPRLEVVQGGPGFSEDRNAVNWSDSSSLSSDSSSSDSSPERITDWISGVKSPSDSTQNTFQMQINHLLTRREKSYMRRTLMRFRENRNISQLVDHMKTILDTEAKQMLWRFLLPRLSEDHQKYVLHNAGISRYLLTDIFSVGPYGSAAKLESQIQSERLNDSSHESATESIGYSNDAVISSSFRHQLGFLLTSRERMQIKKALQIYEERRNVNHLVEDVMELLDTPAKSVLWHHIIPLLSPSDQKYCQRVLPMLLHTVSSGRRIDSSKYSPAVAPPKGASPATPRREDVIYKTNNSAGRSGHIPKVQTHSNFKPLSRPNRMQRSRRPEDFVDDAYGNNSDSSDDSSNESTRRSVGLSGGQTKTSRLQSHHHLRSSRNPVDHSTKKGNESGATQLQVEWNSVSGGAIGNTHNSPSDGAKSKVKMVRESSAQTTPQHQSSSQRQLAVQQPSSSTRNSPVASGNFRTVVKVGEDHPVDNDASSVRSDKTGSGMPSSEASRGILRGSAPSNPVPASGWNGSGDTRDARGSSANVSRSNSFQVQAQSVLRAFDDIVEEELNGDGGNAEGATTSKNTGRNSALLTSPSSGVPPPPPPPPPPLPPASAALQNNPSKPFGLAIKRINWEKLEKVDDNTVWAKIGDGEDLEDVVKYLELEQKFSTKRTTISESFKDRKTEVSILSPKKAYNISILLGHTKMSVSNVKQALLTLDDRILSAELLKQLLVYAPDSDEMAKYDEYRGLLDDLSKADQFIYQISRVPGYLHRLQAMLFKANFAEKIQEVKENLYCLKRASQELLKSKKMARILELVLAMGNYMNKGNSRIGDAPGFRIAFLSQLDLTKTSSGDSTFLHVLADAVRSRFPEVFNLAEDLPTIGEACKVSDTHLTEEISELRKVLQEISSTVNKMTNQKQRAGNNDRFYDVMGHFISHASDELQSLFGLHVSATEEFRRVVQYFGENPKDMTSVEFFTIFREFLTKFEKARQHNHPNRNHPGRQDNRPPVQTK